MYKDKDKQREANRQASQRRRDADKVKGMTAQGMTNEGMTYDNGGITVPDKLGPVIPRRGQGITQPLLHKAVAPKKYALHVVPKRGKDIKCFGDLPTDVRETIIMMSQRCGKIDPIEKAKRTTIAINYQHLFPGMYEPKSWSHSKHREGQEVGLSHRL